jgi:hypothetical protein
VTESNDGEQQYESHSLYESAYCYALGARLIGVTGGRNRCRFLFDDKDSHARELAHKYYNGGTIEARAFVDSLKGLKREADSAFGARLPASTTT